MQSIEWDHAYLSDQQMSVLVSFEAGALMPLTLLPDETAFYAALERAGQYTVVGLLKELTNLSWSDASNRVLFLHSELREVFIRFLRVHKALGNLS